MSLHKRQDTDHRNSHNILPSIHTEDADLPSFPSSSTLLASSGSLRFVDESSFAGLQASSSSGPLVQRAGEAWVAYQNRKVPVLRAIDHQPLAVIAGVAYEVLENNSWFDRDLQTLQGFEWEGMKGIESNTVIGLTKRCIRVDKMSTELGFVTVMGKIQLAAKVRRLVFSSLVCHIIRSKSLLAVSRSLISCRVRRMFGELLLRANWTSL